MLPESTVTEYTPAAISAFNNAATRVKNLFLLENPVRAKLNYSLLKYIRFPYKYVYF